MARLNVESSTATHMTVDGRELLAFGGCNYLGLAHHPAVLGAVREGLAKFGISTTASRETTGNTTVHEALERELAAFMGQEAAILTAEGYTANIAIAQALCHRHGVALIDARAHRSLRSAATSAGMQVFEYEHLNPDSAAWLVRQYGDQGIALFTDGVFAADGAVAPVAELLAILPKQRSTLIVDDCHGVCVLGDLGRGTVSEAGLSDPRLCITTTLAKGFGCYGGAVLGRRALIDQVRENADVYRRSTPAPTPIAMAVRAALGVIQRETELVMLLRRNTAALRQILTDLDIELSDVSINTNSRLQAPLSAAGGTATLSPPTIATAAEKVPIFTFTLESRETMERIHRELLVSGIYAPFIEYPGGPTPMFFRLTVSAKHTLDHLQQLGGELRRAIG
jgi:7-keto-8-aminopelargonate synthetase-like enzyme